MGVKAIGVLLVGTQVVWKRGGGGMTAGLGCCREVTLASAHSQVCVYCHGGPGPAPHGLPLPKHQPLRGELPEDGGKAAGVREAKLADPGDQLGE